MVSSVRQQFNEAFTEEKYRAFLDWMNTRYGFPVFFRISESPIFVPAPLRDKVLDACDAILDVICRPDFRQRSAAALPSTHAVPNETAHTTFLQLDFGICDDGAGGLTPKLIELQGFPSLYCYQHMAATGYRKFFPVPDHFFHLFGGLNETSYLDLLRRVIIGDHRPENVILLEVEPEKQNTAVDFYATKQELGIEVVCITQVKREGKKLFYEKEGRRVPIDRIYNRVIFDELDQRTDLDLAFRFTEELEVEYAGHPNWFFRISKHTMPMLDHPAVPKTWYLDQLPAIPDDLSRYVLKPLFSFSGSGVIIDPTRADIEAIDRPENFILQEKVQYAAAIPTPDEPAKAELRMMFLWEEGQPRPRLVNNLVRMSKGKMVGVKYNKDKTWVGGSVGFFEP